MSYYFVIDRLVHQTEKAVLVKPQGGDNQWLPKSVVGLWDTGQTLIMGVEGYFSLPPAAANWTVPDLTPGQIIEMKYTAEPVNLYSHIQGWVQPRGV